MKRWILLSLALSILLGCTGSSKPVSSTEPVLTEPADLRERALLLLMADRRYYDYFSIGSVRMENPELHASLATSLGRIGDERGLPALHSLLVDPDPEVRREAAFALGLIGAEESVPHLLAALSDDDAETAVWAAVGLVDVGVEIDRMVESMATLSESARWHRLAPVVSRLPPAQGAPWALEGARRPQVEVRDLCLYALARNARPESVGMLRAQIDNPDAWLRGWMARGLGQVGDRTDVARLRALLDSRDPAPIIEALRATRQLVDSGRVAAPTEWQPKLVELMSHPVPGVSLTALEVASAWLPAAPVGSALRQAATEDRRRQREVALLALARGGDDWALDQATRLVTSAEDWQRTLAVEVAAEMEDVELLQYLALDVSPEVRLTAIGAQLNLDPARAATIAETALEDGDPGVRAVAMDWLVDHPVVSADRISRAIIASGSRFVSELRILGVRALLSRGRAEPLERGLVVENLESLARVGEYPARREAASALVDLDRPRPAIGVAGSQKSTNTYMQIVLQTDRDHIVQIDTPHGSLQIELNCTQARMTCLNFLQLARQGYFDGQQFNRVVPDFVVQAGDPRGDGWGGPGYTLRDELNRMRFERGVVGMASSGPDTAGSQFFITLSRQPHLDGRYTAFGRVIEGRAILDQIVQGDRLERVWVVR